MTIGPAAERRRAVFFDRDGTLNKDTGYPSDPAQVHIYPFSFEAVRKVIGLGLAAVVVTYQSGVGRGYITEAELNCIHAHIMASFRREGVPLEAIYSCPHYNPAAAIAAGTACACRKPLPGLALKAAADIGLSLPGSYMIGDKPGDLEFAANTGMTPLLVLTGYGRDTMNALKDGRTVKAVPAYVADNVLDAVEWIRNEEARRPERTQGL